MNKRIIISAVAITVTAILGFSVGNAHGKQHQQQPSREFCVDYGVNVKAITHVMGGEEYQNIVVKQDGYVLYKGHAGNLHDKNVLNLNVSRIALCDDTEDTITILAKERD